MNILSFKQILSEFLRDNHLSQADFAKIAGVKNGQVNEWLKGKVSPNYATLQRLSLAFDVSADYFLGLSEEY